jgi:hypothetical protein
MTAARTGNAAVIRILLSHGAAVNAKENLQGQTALMWRSLNTRRCREPLLEHGADVARARKRVHTAAVRRAPGCRHGPPAARRGANERYATDGSSPLLRQRPRSWSSARSCSITERIRTLRAWVTPPCTGPQVRGRPNSQAPAASDRAQ